MIDPLIQRTVPLQTAQLFMPARPGHPQSIVWKCEAFSIRALPPPSVQYQQQIAAKNEAQNTDYAKAGSPFPVAKPRVSKNDYGIPPVDLSRQDDGMENKWPEKKQLVYKMDLTVVATKKKIHKDAVHRNAVRKRIRAAVRMVVQHGLDYSIIRRAVVQEGDAGPRRFLLPGHAYVFHTSTEVLTMPWHTMIASVRTGLLEVRVSHARWSDIVMSIS